MAELAFLFVLMVVADLVALLIAYKIYKRWRRQ
jgi:hypothetical protein